MDYMLCQKNKSGLPRNLFLKQIFILDLEVFQDEPLCYQIHFYFRLKLFLSGNQKKIIRLIIKIFYQFSEVFFAFSFFTHLFFSLRVHLKSISYACLFFYGLVPERNTCCLLNSFESFLPQLESHWMKHWMNHCSSGRNLKLQILLTLKGLALMIYLNEKLMGNNPWYSFIAD